MSASHSLRTSMKRSLFRSLCAFVLSAVASTAMAVPTPEVTGPIPYDEPGSADRNYPFLATDMNLAHRGYVEEEFFFSGTANRYNAQSRPEFRNRPPASPSTSTPSIHEIRSWTARSR
jgi:hypothetical protein